MIDVTFIQPNGNRVERTITQELWDLGLEKGFWGDGDKVYILINHKMTKI